MKPRIGPSPILAFTETTQRLKYSRSRRPDCLVGFEARRAFAPEYALRVRVPSARDDQAGERTDRVKRDREARRHVRRRS